MPDCCAMADPTILFRHKLDVVFAAVEVRSDHHGDEKASGNLCSLKHRRASPSFGPDGGMR
jgi:hypothetical protein